jgi:very-short-patch-repair endonuclease
VATIKQARALRKNLTNAERALWNTLSRRQIAGAKFRRQQVLGSYIVDFVCFEKRLIVEVDGGQHADQLTYDVARTAWLETQGYRVLRFWNNEVLGNIAGVTQVILDTVEQM